MKKTLTLIAFVALVGYVSFREGQKSGKGYGYSAEWGCYQGARKACDRIQDEQKVSECQEDALDFCPKAGIAFKKFMAQGRR